MPESQCGFRSNRETVDMIFMLRQIQEKCREQNIGLDAAFGDLTKAFDTVSRDELWKIMVRFGCPPNSSPSFTSSIKGQQGQVKHKGSLLGNFPSPMASSRDVSCPHTVLYLLPHHAL